MINEALAGERSKLKLIVDGKDYTSQLRNFMSGVHELLRNSRHHRLIKDDAQTALAVFQVAILIAQFMDTSEPRNTMDNLYAHKVPGLEDLIRSHGAHLIYLPPYSPDFDPIELARLVMEDGFDTFILWAEGNEQLSRFANEVAPAVKSHVESQRA